MTHQEDGWPLGLLQPLNARVGLLRNNSLLNGSVSFNTLLTPSPTSSTNSSSSDIDTQSSSSFFHDNSITLGSLLGASSILELSRRSSTRRRRVDTKKHNKFRASIFSICSRLSTDAVTINNNTPSLQYYLEAEKRAANFYTRSQSTINRV